MPNWLPAASCHVQLQADHDDAELVGADHLSLAAAFSASHYPFVCSTSVGSELEIIFEIVAVQDPVLVDDGGSWPQCSPCIPKVLSDTVPLTSQGLECNEVSIPDGRVAILLSWIWTSNNKSCSSGPAGSL